MKTRKLGPIRRFFLLIEIYDFETHGFFLLLLSASIFVGAVFDMIGLVVAVTAMLVFANFYANRRDAPAKAELLEALLDFIGPENVDDLKEYWTDWKDAKRDNILSRRDSICCYRTIENKQGPRALRRKAKLKAAQHNQDRVLK